jgi:hypothetical protein
MTPLASGRQGAHQKKEKQSLHCTYPMNTQQLGEDSASAEAWDRRSKPLAKSSWALIDWLLVAAMRAGWLKSTSNASDQPLLAEE